MDQKIDSEPTTSRISDNNNTLLENQLLSQCQKIQGMITQLLIEQNCLMNLLADFVYQRQNQESNNNPLNVQNESSFSEDKEEKLKQELEKIIKHLNEMKMLDGAKKTTATNVADTTNRLLASIFPYDIAAVMNWSGTGKNNKIGIKNYPEIIEAVKDNVRNQCKEATDQEIEAAIKLWFQRKRTGNKELRKSR